jgi:hypothetical protein
MEEITLRIPSGKIRIKEGTCPHGCSLIDKKKLMSGQPAISVEVRLRGETGSMHFNPYYGIFDYETDVELHPGDVVDLYCPHCKAALTVPDLCGMCQVHMFAIQLPDGGEMRACPLIGCRNHKLTIIDLDAQFAEFYDEECRPKM